MRNERVALFGSLSKLIWKSELALFRRTDAERRSGLVAQWKFANPNPWLSHIEVQLGRIRIPKFYGFLFTQFEPTQSTSVIRLVMDYLCRYILENGSLQLIAETYPAYCIPVFPGRVQ